MSVEAYRTNNVLRVEVTSRDVAALAASSAAPVRQDDRRADSVDGGTKGSLKVKGQPYRTIWPGADGASVEIIDQTRLPHEFCCREAAHGRDAATPSGDACSGAPLIGATAAYGLWLALRADASDEALASAGSELLATRPTAVNLRWAVERVTACLRPCRPRCGRRRPSSAPRDL